MAKKVSKDEKTKAPAKELTYFSMIRLRHHTGQYLSSADVKYTHTRGSGQQIVGCSIEDESSWWLIRPYNGGDFEKKALDVVKEGDVIRLQHVETGRNLRSHTYAPPLCPDQLEVSCGGENGLGSHEDDWVVETREQSGVTTDAILLFKHVVTGNYLHSYDDRHFDAANKSFQEVTSFSGNDSNNDWKVCAVREVDKQPVLYPFISFDAAGVPLTFNTAIDLKGWLDSEREEYGWLLKRPASAPGHETVGDQVENHFSELDILLISVLAPDAPANAEDYHQRAKTAFSEYYSQSGALASRDSKYIFAKSLAQKDPNVATHALAYFLGLEPESTAAGFKGSFAALTFEAGLSDRAQIEAESLASLKRDFERDIAQQKTKHVQIETVIDATFSAAKQHLADQDHNFKLLVKKSEDDLQALTKTYDEHMGVEAAVIYWKRKAFWHRIAFGIMCLLAAGTGTGVVYGLIQLILVEFQGQVGQTAPDWWRVGAGVVISTFGIWAVRVMVQLLYSNAHLMSDANERAVMVEVYIAMLRKQQLPLLEEHKLLILQSLFRPAATGVVKDDGSPTTWLDFVASKLGGNSN